MLAQSPDAFQFVFTGSLSNQPELQPGEDFPC